MPEARLRIKKEVYLVPAFARLAVSPASNGWGISPVTLPLILNVQSLILAVPAAQPVANLLASTHSGGWCSGVMRPQTCYLCSY